MLAASTAQLYIREPVAIDERLTLDRFYSEELGSDYSAVYRSIPEFQQMFDAYLMSAGFSVKHADWLYSPELSNRVETAQHYWVLSND